MGAGFDAVPFIEEQYARIPVLHIRDGIRGQRKGTVGQCGVRIRDVLQLLKREKYLIGPISNTITVGQRTLGTK
jgi:hypothetical protein